MANPDLHREAANICTVLAQRSAAAGEHAVMAALRPLVLVYGVGEAAKAPAFWEAYKVLSGVPAEALAAGVREYLAAPDSEFFPKPGPLKALCDKQAEPLFKAAYRASRAASLPAPKRKPTEAERMEVHRMAEQVAEVLKTVKPKTIPGRDEPAPAGPYIGGEPDERGITKEMREAMARRSERA